MYGNEKAVGEALRASGVPREDVFVTTKLAGDNLADAKASFARSQELLGTYADALLIHWPGDGYVEAWRACEEIVASGGAKCAGVSNFGVQHLEALAKASAMVPAINQIEAHPFLPRPKLREFCAARDIVVEAFCPLARAKRMDDPALVSIAADVGKTPAQVMLRWCIENDMVILPKSSNPDRIRENADVFSWELGAAATERLAALGAANFSASVASTKWGQLDCEAAAGGK